MSKKRVFFAVATLVGCIIGAGILGIPYFVARAGIVSGLLVIVALGLLFMLINLYLGEVTLRTKGTHYLSYYAEKYLGRAGKRAMFISLVVGIYGALVAYLMGEGAALSSVLGIDPLLGGVIAFVILSYAVYNGLGFISVAESIMMPIILSFIVILFLFAAPNIHIEPKPVNLESLILPIGVVMFAFLGTSAIPEIKEELEDNKSLKKAIIIASAIPIVAYSLFTLAIVGVLGEGTREVATLGIEAILGSDLAFLGSILPILTMSTSFMALGLCLSKVFEKDYGLRKNTSWLLACFVPFILYLLFYLTNLASFGTILNITGVITGFLTIALIILMAYQAKESGDRRPEYSIYLNKGLAVLIIAFALIASILEFII
jgi:tyrosine-specific transport protein